MQKHFIIKEYCNGIYQGDILHSNIREGLGVYLWDSGEFYFGEWSKDYIEGEGILYFPYGGYIRGLFKKNNAHGFAILHFPNGDFYKGEWKDGRLDGRCYKYFREKNSWILCEYKEGIYQNLVDKGKGNIDISEFNEKKLLSLDNLSLKYNLNKTIDIGYKYKYITFPDNGKYIGIIKDDLPNGLGMFHYADGKIDEGFYKNGLLDGFGKLNFYNGDIYDGMMKNGLFEGYGIFYKKTSNKWIYGLFEENRCSKVLETGINKPSDIIEFVKADQHKSSEIFINKETSCQTFKIPVYSELKNNLGKTKSQGSFKKMDELNSKTKPQKFLKKHKSTIIVKNIPSMMKNKNVDASINTENRECKNQSVQTTIEKMLIDSWTQTENYLPNIDESESVKTSIYSEKKDEKLSHYYTNKEDFKKTINEQSSLVSDQDFGEKKRLTKCEIETLFKSVKNMISGIKEKDTSGIQNSQKYDIRNLKESTDFLIQKLENIKKSQGDFLKQSSLQSSDFLLSKSESAFQNFEGNLNNNNNNNNYQKNSNMIESRLLESYFSSNNNLPILQNNDFNISKSIDFFEKLLNSQIFSNGVASKESRAQNSIALNQNEYGDQNTFTDQEIDQELFHSKVMSSYKNLPCQEYNETTNFPLVLVENLKNIENNLAKEKILIFDQDQEKHTKERMAKYSSGIEKIEEKAEEVNASPNGKNKILNLNSLNNFEIEKKVLKECNSSEIRKNGISKNQINLPLIKDSKKKLKEQNKNDLLFNKGLFETNKSKNHQSNDENARNNYM